VNHINKPTRYAANLQTPKTPDSVIALRKVAGANGTKPAQKRALKGKLREIAAKTAATVSEAEGPDSVISRLAKENSDKSPAKNDQSLINRIRKIQADYENEKSGN